MLATEFGFSALGNLVLFGWAALAISILTQANRRVSAAALFTGGVLVPGLLATLPLLRLAFATGPAPGDLFSLNGVKARFAEPEILMLLYFEALCFSLFVGGLIVRDGRARGMPSWLVAPNLALLFLKGPIGGLVYAGCRAAFDAVARRRRLGDRAT